MSEKQQIPKAVKDNVWNYYIGEKLGISECFCCRGIMGRGNFSCGHVIAKSKGGETTIKNLRPICVSCNSSIGTEDMENFMKRYGIKRCVNWFGTENISKMEIGRF